LGKKVCGARVLSISGIKVHSFGVGRGDNKVFADDFKEKELEYPTGGHQGGL